MIFVSNFTKREQIVILIFVIAIILSLGYQMYIKKDLELIKADTKYEDIETINAKSIDEEKGNFELGKDTIEPKKIMVHIDGEIMNPGVVEVLEGARVIDVVNIAGGLTQYADEKRINLAKKIYDEEKIYIPKIGEDISELEMVTTNHSDGKNNSQGKININTATKEELQKLSGIGPVLAERIIEHRQSNKFTNINDIKKVSGIGDKKFEAIKDFIVVK